MTEELEDHLRKLAGGIAGLQDLFARRLVGDREARRREDDLRARLDELTRLEHAENVRPLVLAIARVVDRLQRDEQTDSAQRLSVADELVDVIETMGARPIRTDLGFDPQRHQVNVVRGGEGGGLSIVDVLRDGYEKDGIILRPALVDVVRVDVTDPQVAEPASGLVGEASSPDLSGLDDNATSAHRPDSTDDRQAATSE